MTWIYLSLMAPLLWSLSNILDKFAIEHITSNYIPFIFLLSIGNIFFAAAILTFIDASEIDPLFASLNILSGLAIFLQYFAYSYSLEDMDVSVVIPIHQSEPLFVLAASILIFHAFPTHEQFLGFFLITGGILSLCLSKKTILGLGERRHVAMVFVSAFFGAISTIISDEILKSKNLEFVLLFNFSGYAFGGLLLLLNPAWRRLIIQDLKVLNARQFSIFAATNLFDVGGYVFFMAALAVGGGAALVSVVVSIHPVFVLIFGIIATRFFPNFISEDIAPSGILRKSISILIIISGISIAAFNDM